MEIEKKIRFAVVGAGFVGKRHVFNDREFAGGNKSVVAFERFQIA